MNNYDLSQAYFQHLKAIEEENKIEMMIDQKISLYMQGNDNPKAIKEEIKQELKEEIKQELYYDIRRMVRECIQTEPLNIKFKF